MAGEHLSDVCVPSSEDRRSRYPDVLKLITSSFAAPLGALVTGPLLARTLGPHGRGIVASISAPILLLQLLAPMSLGEACAYFVSRTGAGRTAMLRRYGTAAFAASLPVVGAAVTVLAAFDRADRQHPALFLALSMTVPVVAAQSVLRGVASGMGLFSLVAAETALSALLRTVLVVGLAVGHSLTVASASVVTCAVGPFAGVYLLRVYCWPDRGEAAPSYVQVMPFSLRSWAGNVVGIANYRADQSLMIGLTSPTQLGFYAVAVAVAQVPVSIAGSLRGYLVTRGAGNSRSAALTSARLTILASVVGLVLVAALSPWWMPLLYGREFVPSVNALAILCLASLFAIVGNIQASLAAARGRPGLSVVPQLAGAAIGFPTLIFLTPQFGSVGAAVASLSTYLVMAIVSHMVLRRRITLRLSEYLVARSSDYRDALTLFRRMSPGVRRACTVGLVGSASRAGPDNPAEDRSGAS